MAFGEAMDQDANRHLCNLLPKNSTTLPTLSNTSRQDKFHEFLQNAQSVTRKQSVWIDGHREATPPQSGSLIITTAMNLETKSYKNIA